MAKTKQKDMPAKCAMFWDSERGFYDETKPETPKRIWAELLLVDEDKEKGACVYRLKRVTAGAKWIELDENEIKKLRAAQPKIKCGDCGDELTPAELICVTCGDRFRQKNVAKARAEGMAQGKNAILDNFESWFKGAQMIPNYDVCKNGLGLIEMIRSGQYEVHVLEKAQKTGGA